MVVQVTPRQRDLLVQLLSEELGEIGSEIHHAAISSYKHDLQDERRELRDLLDRLRLLNEDTLRTPDAQVTSSDALGMA